MPKIKVNVTQDKEEPITKDVLANAIWKLSECSTRLLASGLNQKAIVILLADSTKLPKNKIKLVLESLSQLRVDYTHDLGA